MKKLINGMAAALVSVAMILSLTGCPGGDPVDEDDAIWEGAEIIESLAGQETNWGTAITIPSSVLNRVQVGSKIIFTLDKGLDSGTGDKYLKFHLDNGNWGSCGIDKYYKANGKELPVAEDVNNAGVFNSDVDGLELSTYYAVVTEDNIDLVKAGVGFQGCVKVVKVGITNLAEKPDTSGAAVVSGGEVTFTAIKSSYSDEDVVALFKIDRTAPGKAEKFTLSELDMTVTLNDEEVTVPEEMTCTLDPYSVFDGKDTNEDGSAANEADMKEYKFKLQLNKKISAGDVLKVKLNSAKVTGAEADVTEDVVKSMTVAFTDINAKSSYWNPLVDEGDNFKSVITSLTGEIEIAE